MELQTLAENIATWILACGLLWTSAQATLHKPIKPILHQFRETYLKNEKVYAFVIQAILALIAFAGTFANPESFDLFAMINPNIKSVFGLVDYQHWMGALVTTVPVVVFAGEEIHNRYGKKDEPTNA